MRDIGGLVWVVIVVIGVISSIVKNAKKAAAQREAARPRMAQPAKAQSAAPQPTVQRATFAQMIAPPVVPPAGPPPARRVKVPSSVVPPRMVIEREASAGATSPIRGMFGAGTSLVRAIVAAEVLGSPKALQEQSIWSPRHNEPSI